MANFFIHRPIFAWVIALLLMLAGTLAIQNMPVSQYPAIAPPIVSITTVYPGATSQTLESTVTQVIEQKLNGIDNIRYFSATSDALGNLSINVIFNTGTDPDKAVVQVQNQVQLANPLLPLQVQQQGVRVRKAAINYMMIISLISDDPKLTRNDLTDYVASKLQDPISRINGVGDFKLFGTQYAMRIWVNPQKLLQYNLTVQDITDAITSQNTQISVGQLGGTPAIDHQQLNAPIIAQTRLTNVQDFEHILVKVRENGSSVYLKDVSTIELGGENYNTVSFYNENQPAGAMAIILSPDANALQTAQAVRQKIDELSHYFPDGMRVVYPLDTTPFVKISIYEVIKTLVEAIILVFLVMFLFLQNIRTTLIPTIAIPVVLLGTFAVLSLCGFTINTLTLFGIVLAIGLLVDDAIVVVENVERVMSDENLTPIQATIKSMSQISGALIGIGLVLVSVFIPMAFIKGSGGVIYRQFSVSLVASVTLSVFVALTLTPALCASFLKNNHTSHKKRSSYRFFDIFNRWFDNLTRRYQHAVSYMIDYKSISLVFFAVFIGITGFLFSRLHTGLLPAEDQGYMYTQVTLPQGATLDRTVKVLNEVRDYFLHQEREAVESVLVVGGVNFSGSSQNSGLMFIKMKDWELRSQDSLKVQSVANRATKKFVNLKDAIVIPFVPPAVAELGNATGIDFQLLDGAGLGHDKLMGARNQFLELASKDPSLTRVRPNGLEDTVFYRIKIDQKKAMACGLSLASINNTLSTAWGSNYVNDFEDEGRTKKVYVQALAPYRMLPENLNDWYIRNAQGQMICFSTFCTGSWTLESPRLERFNGHSSLEILAEPAPGYSTGQAMQAVERIVQKLPKGIGLQWFGISFEERLSDGQAPILYTLSLLIVFLCLAALYESWSVPFAILLVVPLGILGAVLSTSIRGLSNDLYFQVGLLTTVGLATKNAILIVEFARTNYLAGVDLLEATLQAVKQRLRPIVMTSMAFALGVLPLYLANGAGSGSQMAIGTCVLGGVFASTFLGIFFIPLLFVVITQIFQIFNRPPQIKG